MKTKSIITSFAIGILAALSSCSGGGSSIMEVSYLPAKAVDDSRWSFVNARGELLYESEFSNMPSAVVNGIFSVEEGKGITVYNADEKMTQVGDLEGLKAAGHFNCGVMPITRPKSRIECVDANGKTRFTVGPVDGQEVVLMQGTFINNCATFTTEKGMMGVISPDGSVLIQPTWNLILPFLEDYTLAAKYDNEETQAYLIDKSGNTIAKVNGNPTGNVFMYGRIALFEPDGTLGFMDSTGAFSKVPAKVSNIKQWNKDYYVFGDGSSMGLMTFDGETVIRPKYDSMIILPNGNIYAELDGKNLILTPQGEEITRLPNTYVLDFISLPMVFNSDFCIVGNKSVKNFYNENGEETGTAFLDILGSLQFGGVETDYFDVDKVVATITDPITTEGFGKYVIGTPMKDFATGDPGEYLYTYFFNIEDMPSGYKFSSNGNVSSAAAVGDSKFMPDTYTWENFFNPESKIDAVNIGLSTEHVDDVIEGILNALYTKGFKLINTDDANYWLSNEKAQRYIRLYHNEGYDYNYYQSSTAFNSLSGEIRIQIMDSKIAINYDVFNIEPEPEPEPDFDESDYVVVEDMS